MIDLLDINTIEYQLMLHNLGFKEEPFSTSYDPRFHYLSDQHKFIFYRLRKLIEERKGLHVIQGLEGVGKSSLARLINHIYADREDEKYAVVYLPYGRASSEFELLMKICNLLRLPKRKGATEQWHEFEKYLVNRYNEDKKLLLIIDEAQNLASSSLGGIHRINQLDSTNKVVQIVLFGQPKLSSLFGEKPEILSIVDNLITLNRLNIFEAMELFNFRCRVAGRTEPLLSQSHFTKIWQATSGLPKNLILVCQKIIRGVDKKGPYVITEKIIDRAISGIGL